MKKKILSILVAFIICLSPVLLLTGCGDDNSTVVFPSGIETGWTVKQNGKFSDCQWSGSGEISYTAITRDKAEADKDGGYTYNEKTYTYEKEGATITVADAIKEGSLTCVGGFNSSGDVGSTFKMTIMFGDKRVKVTCTIVENTDTPPEGGED